MTQTTATTWFLDYLHLRILDSIDAYDAYIMLQMADEIEKRTGITY
jgi:hypothetical protein